jgi:tRNA-dihydrouridine synthase
VKARKTKSKQNKGPIEVNINKGCRKAEWISSKAGSEATIQSEVKASERKSKQKGPI